MKDDEDEDEADADDQPSLEVVKSQSRYVPKQLH